MAQIGGPHVQVTSILSSPGTDPHLYESDIASALAVARARLVIANGAGSDDFMSQLRGATVKRGGWCYWSRRCSARTGPT